MTTAQASFQANCPACGAAVRFQIGTSLVTVCEYCRSVIARGDKQLEDLGKVADIIESGSPLELWLQGRYEGVPFTLTGRAQLGHPAGGMWDEWYAAFANGTWGWLAEAQGRFFMTFEQPLPADMLLPTYEDLQLGDRLTLIPGQPALTVAEKSEARTLAAKGEIPYRLMPGVSYPFADLSGPSGEFGTIDYGDDPPDFYLGKEVTLADLGVADRKRGAEREGRRVGALQLNCPNCGGGLALHAPDQTERVVCPNCAGMLDCSRGKLTYLKSLEKQDVTPALPLGQVGKLPEGDLTVIGFVVRSVKVEGQRYFWEEYLLYEPKIGFRWMVCSDDHWSYVKPVPVGEVNSAWSGHATYQGTSFKAFQSAVARVDYVVGEFYWKVKIGEKVEATDFVSPPRMLSREVFKTEESQEVNWSLGQYLTPAEVAKAFSVPRLPRPSGVAPHQPFRHWGVYWVAAALILVASLIAMSVWVLTPRRTVFEKDFVLEPQDNPEKSQVIFSEPFELKGYQNIRVTARSEVTNSWAAVMGDLIQVEEGDRASDLVQPFDIPVEYYEGVEDGEHWSEGNRQKAVYLSSLPAGKYVLRLEVEREHYNQPGTLHIEIEQGVPRLEYFVFLMIALASVPVVIGAYHYSFEHRRWQNSDFGGQEE